jgi:hypothetical protein
MGIRCDSLGVNWTAHSRGDRIEPEGYINPMAQGIPGVFDWDFWAEVLWKWHSGMHNASYDV